MHENFKKTTELLENFSVDKEKLFQKIIPNIQEVIVDLLRPSEEELLNWKTSSLGKLHFREYLNSKCKKIPSDKQISALWNYYMGNITVQRSKSLVKLFKQINRNEKFCSYCKSSTELQVDHIIPLVKGGVDELENLQYLCSTCNLSKHGKYDFLELIC